jgi:hypothetical protein
MDTNELEDGKEAGFPLSDGLGVSHFAPSVLIDGRSFQPPGWMWIWAYAMAEVPWAMKEAMTPEFRAQVNEWLQQHGGLINDA